MFSLIITIIAIALGAALTVASLFYGGSAFTQNTAKSTASAVISQAQQITAANTLYSNDNGGVFIGTDPSSLATTYLSTVPTVPTAVALGGGASAWALESTSSNTAYVRLSSPASDEACKQINKQSFGSATIGGTTGHTGGGFGTTAVAGPVSAGVIGGIRAAMTAQFGCVRVDSDNVVVYRG